jgi:hypothetical protein
LPNANIIDTDQATLVGSWNTSTATPGYIGPNYRYAAKGDGTTSATWPVAGNGPNELWVMYTSGSNRASNATYTVHHAGGQTKNQRGESKGSEPLIFYPSCKYVVGGSI